MGGSPFQSRLKKLKKRFTAPSEELQDKTFIDASVLQHIVNRRNPELAFQIFTLAPGSSEVDLLADKYATKLLNLVTPLLPPPTATVESTSSTAYNVVWQILPANSKLYQMACRHSILDLTKLVTAEDIDSVASEAAENSSVMLEG